MNKEQENINIRMSYSEKFNSALDADSALNDETNYLLNRFLAADWGDVSGQEAADNNEVINLRKGIVTGKYTALGERICIELCFEDECNASLKLRFQNEE